MNIQFQNKVVVITGAGGGIGTAMAKAFAADGATVAVCDLKGAEATVAAILADGGRAEAFTLDVTDRACAARVMGEIAAKFGGIDVMINNAGINVGPDKRQFTDEFDDKWWDAILSVDLDGVYNCSKAAIPYMKERTGSSMINISSVVGMVPFRRQCAFNGAKAGVIHFSKAMALELADYGIRVNVIAPGSVTTPGTQTLWTKGSAMEGLLNHIPQHRQGSTEDIAHAALFLASDYASYITGTVLNVDGGWICGYARDF